MHAVVVHCEVASRTLIMGLVSARMAQRRSSTVLVLHTAVTVYTTGRTARGTAHTTAGESIYTQSWGHLLLVPHMAVSALMRQLAHTRQLAG